MKIDYDKLIRENAYDINRYGSNIRMKIYWTHEKKIFYKIRGFLNKKYSTERISKILKLSNKKTYNLITSTKLYYNKLESIRQEKIDRLKTLIKYHKEVKK